MKQHLENRNKLIRLHYSEKKRSGMPQSEIIQELVREFSAYELKADTIIQIVNNPNYGKTKFGIWIVRTSVQGGCWLMTKENKRFVEVSKSRAEKKCGKLIKDLQKEVGDITQWYAKEVD